MINQERLEKAETIELQKGSHTAPTNGVENGACIMELVSWVANEPWSYQPECTCPIISGFAVALNDKFNDAHRQSLKPFILKLIGTSTDDNGLKVARVRLLRWRFVTATYPAILDTLELTEIAAKLRTFENTLESIDEAKQFLIDSKPAIRNAYAYALREKLVPISLETLDMLINLKIEEVVA